MLALDRNDDVTSSGSFQNDLLDTRSTKYGLPLESSINISHPAGNRSCETFMVDRSQFATGRGGLGRSPQLATEISEAPVSDVLLLLPQILITNDYLEIRSQRLLIG
jgi:hypothetical protein